MFFPILPSSHANTNRADVQHHAIIVFFIFLGAWELCQYGICACASLFLYSEIFFARAFKYAFYPPIVPKQKKSEGNWEPAIIGLLSEGRELGRIA